MGKEKEGKFWRLVPVLIAFISVSSAISAFQASNLTQESTSDMTLATQALTIANMDVAEAVVNHYLGNLSHVMYLENTLSASMAEPGDEKVYFQEVAQYYRDLEASCYNVSEAAYGNAAERIYEAIEHYETSKEKNSASSRIDLSTILFQISVTLCAAAQVAKRKSLVFVASATYAIALAQLIAIL